MAITDNSDATPETGTTDRADTTRPATPPPAASRSGGPSVLALFAGGFIAAGLGYAAAYYGEFGLFDDTDEAAQEMAQIVAAHETRIDEIEALLGAPDEVTDRLDASDAGLSELRESLGSLLGNVGSLDERIGGVEAGIAGLAETRSDAETTPGADASAFDPAVLEELSSNTDSLQSELRSGIEDLAARIDALDTRTQDLSGQLETQRTAISEAEAAATEETRRISVEAAFADIRAALEEGSPYADAEATLTQSGDLDVPAALSDPAGSGVATLASLQDSFPEAARAGLDASLQETAGGTIDRLGAFLKAQTGARAIGEREGTGPDAILSRAEARLNEGDLAASLSEIEALPQPGRDAMSDWLDRARTRLDAKQALADLSQSTTSN